MQRLQLKQLISITGLTEMLSQLFGDFEFVINLEKWSLEWLLSCSRSVWPQSTPLQRNGRFVVSGSSLTGKPAWLSCCHYSSEFACRPPTPPPQRWACSTSTKTVKPNFFSPCYIQDHCHPTSTSPPVPSPLKHKAVIFTLTVSLTQAVWAGETKVSPRWCAHVEMSFHFIWIG